MPSITSKLARPAEYELRSLAAAMRPDWDADQLSGAMVAAHTSGWSWPRMFTEVCRMLTDDRAQPTDLRDASRQPLGQIAAADPDAVDRAAAGAKSALAEALFVLDQRRCEAEEADRAERSLRLADAPGAVAGGDAG